MSRMVPWCSATPSRDKNAKTTIFRIWNTSEYLQTVAVASRLCQGVPWTSSLSHPQDDANSNQEDDKTAEQRGISHQVADSAFRGTAVGEILIGWWGSRLRRTECS